jgi:hypothetical protein
VTSAGTASHLYRDIHEQPAVLARLQGLTKVTATR